MSETMQGRRVSGDVLPCDYEPGDYGKRGEFWWVCLPTGVLGRLDHRWKMVEHDDCTATLGDPPGSVCVYAERGEACKCEDRGGPTITVSPSIWDTPQGWHGWLEHGVWRSV